MISAYKNQISQKETQSQTSNQHFKHDSRPKTCKTLKKSFKTLVFLMSKLKANVRGESLKGRSTTTLETN